MEDGLFLSKEDKEKMVALQKELEVLKAEHKLFASTKSKLTPEDRERWRVNSQRTNQIHIDIKEMRVKNILEGGR